jgi:hypothetical protein
VKLSHPALFAVPQFESPVGALIWPVQVTFTFDSETFPEVGLAPRVFGISTTALATPNRQTDTANVYLSRLIVERLFESASFLNISDLLLQTIHRLLLRHVFARDEKARQIALPGLLVLWVTSS